MNDPFRRFLDLIPEEGYNSPACRFVLEVLIETGGGPSDEALAAAAEEVAR